MRISFIDWLFASYMHWNLNWIRKYPRCKVQINYMSVREREWVKAVVNEDDLLGSLAVLSVISARWKNYK